MLSVSRVPAGRPSLAMQGPEEQLSYVELEQQYFWNTGNYIKAGSYCGIEIFTVRQLGLWADSNPKIKAIKTWRGVVAHIFQQAIFQSDYACELLSDALSIVHDRFEYNKVIIAGGVFSQDKKHLTKAMLYFCQDGKFRIILHSFSQDDE